MNFSRPILISLLLILPIAFWPASNSYDAIKFTLLASATSLWLAYAGWQQWQGRSVLSLNRKALASWVSLIIVFGVGIFGACNPGLVVRTYLIVSMFALVVYQTSRQSGGLSGQRSLLIATSISATVAAIYGLLQWNHILPGAPVATGYPTAISTLGNQNYLASLMAVAFWPTLVLWRQINSKWPRLMVLAAMILILSVLVQAKAAGPQLAFLSALALLGIGWTLVRKNKSKLVPWVLGSLILMIAVGGFGFIFNASLQNKLLADNSGSTRRTDWLIAVQMFKGQPVSGVGAGNFLVNWPETKAQLATSNQIPTIAQGSPVSTRAHNDFLQWVAETGSLGLLWFLSLIIIFAGTWQKRFNSQNQFNQIDYLIITTGVLTVAIHSMVSFPFHLPATSLVFSFLIGLLLLQGGPHPQMNSGRIGKFQGLVFLALAVVFSIGSIQEFWGDLQTAQGRRLFTQGKMSQANEQLSQGIHKMKWPGHGRLHWGLTQAALAASKNNGTTTKSAAENNFRLSLSDKPSFEAMLALAEASINKGDYSTGQKYLDLVVNCEPHLNFRIQAQFHKALIAVRQGRLTLAQNIFTKLLLEDPQEHRALLGLGFIEARQGQIQQAKKYYIQAITIIDRKISEFRPHQGQQSAAFIGRLKQNRQVADKALKALSSPP